MTLYWPVPSVTTVRVFSRSAGLDASTVTPGSTAPDASLTTPAIEALPCDCDEGAPAIADVVADEHEPPQQRDRIVEIAGDRGRRALEGATSDVRGPFEVAFREVHQRQVPHEMVVEPVQAGAAMRGRR